MEIGEQYLGVAKSQFRDIKGKGERALAQATEDDMWWTPNEESNSIGVIVRHMHGNMLSRWTDFLTTDGEKPWRTRDEEFVARTRQSKAELLALWEAGWERLLAEMDTVTAEDLSKDVTLRGAPMNVMDAIERQLNHAVMHVGQIMWIVKACRGASFETLSIARGKSLDALPPDLRAETERHQSKP